MSTKGIAACGIVFFACVLTVLAQDKQPEQGSKWIENKVDVRIEKATLDERGEHLTLAYTVTNKTGANLQLEWRDDPSGLHEDVESLRDRIQGKQTSASKSVRVKLFYKLKEPSSYAEIPPPPKNLDLWLNNDFLPDGLPTRFAIVARVQGSRSSWFSSRERSLRKALYDTLGNVESIVVLVPSQRLKITFPIPKAP